MLVPKLPFANRHYCRTKKERIITTRHSRHNVCKEFLKTKCVNWVNDQKRTTCKRIHSLRLGAVCDNAVTGPGSIPTRHVSLRYGVLYVDARNERNV